MRSAGGAAVTELLLNTMVVHAREHSLIPEILDRYAESGLPNVHGRRLINAVGYLAHAETIPDASRLKHFLGNPRVSIDEHEANEFWELFLRTVRENKKEISDLLGKALQHNYVSRAPALLAALLAARQRSAFPIRLLEPGASAGLNLRPDEFSYRIDTETVLGPPQGEVIIPTAWKGKYPRPEDTGHLKEYLNIGERRGCDVHPVDTATPENRIWQTVYAAGLSEEQRATQIAALRLAEDDPVTIDQVSVGPWLSGQLAIPAPRMLTVVWHSYVRRYVDPEEWNQVEMLFTNTGKRSTSETPFMVVSFDQIPAHGHGCELTVRSWAGDGTEKTWSVPTGKNDIEVSIDWALLEAFTEGTRRTATSQKPPHGPRRPRPSKSRKI
ncbi:MAG: DUF2332 family protein [Mycobacteriales bacterium]